MHSTYTFNGQVLEADGHLQLWEKGVAIEVVLNRSQYTPEQQQLIEARFGIARAEIAARREEGDYARALPSAEIPPTNTRDVPGDRVTDMHVDEALARMWNGTTLGRNQSELPKWINGLLGRVETDMRDETVRLYGWNTELRDLRVRWQ